MALFLFRYVMRMRPDNMLTGQDGDRPVPQILAGRMRWGTGKVFCRYFFSQEMRGTAISCRLRRGHGKRRKNDE